NAALRLQCPRAIPSPIVPRRMPWRSRTRRSSRRVAAAAGKPNHGGTMAKTRKKVASKARAKKSTKPSAARPDVAALKGKLKTVAAVAATVAAPKIPAKKTIHRRRLIPRVPTGTYRSDTAPSAALALRQALDISAGARLAEMAMAETDTIAFTRNVQLNDVS